MPIEPVAFGPFLFRPDSRTLFREGELVAIGQRSAVLLRTLLKSPGEVVTKAELMEAVWPGMTVEESNLSVQVASLRKHLGPSPDGGEWIATIPRVGYRFIVNKTTPATRAHIIQGEVVIPSLAVLPFQNLSSDPEQDYFADGVVDEIITALSRFRSFAVIARNSSFVYKGRAVDVRQVAQDLGVRYVLEGSLRKGGAKLRIAAQLVDGLTGTHLWARHFEGNIDDVFDFQDRITEEVVTLVEPHIQTAEIKRSLRQRPESLAAYDFYIQALPKLYAETEVGNAEANALLTRALALEPDNATILVHAAFALGHRQTMGWSPIANDDASKGAELSRRALDLADGDARIMAMAATDMLHNARDNDLAVTVVRTAVDTNPNDLAVVFRAGIVYLHAGDVEDAISLFHRAIRLSPVDPAAHFSLTGLAHAQMILGDFEAALSWSTRSLAVNSHFPATYWMLISASAQLGRIAEAHRHLDGLRKIVPGATIASIKSGQPRGDPSRLAAIIEGLRVAGLAEK
jgi:TolB-like protein/tetratricopeptide (TPR) repeat protein